jgi:hypothetical protein
MTKKLISKPKEKVVFIKTKFKTHISTAILTAFGLLMALVWKDLIQKIINENIPYLTIEKYPYLSELYSAILVTLIATLGIILVSKWADKN